MNLIITTKTYLELIAGVPNNLIQFFLCYNGAWVYIFTRLQVKGVSSKETYKNRSVCVT